MEAKRNEEVGESSASKKLKHSLPDEEEDLRRCTFLLPKKRRRCRLNRLQGQIFCAEHICVDNGGPGDDGKDGDGVNNKKKNVMVRQPCPYDPKHTVSVSRLKEHLKKCNSRPPVEVYYEPSANTVTKPEDGEELNILTMTQSEKISLIMKLVEFHKAEVPPIPNLFGIHDYLKGDFVKSNVGESALRHSTQIGSIAKILDDHGLLKDSTCFIEFGSGRGGLSYGLARVVNELGLKNTKFILIDRTSPRYKKDNQARKDLQSEINIERIKISIEHLLVGKLPEIANYENIVGVTKHLCGSGTDVALRSLFGPKADSERGKVRGLVFATCCHHRTEYCDFVGNEFLPTEFSDGNFRALRQIAAWATNGDYASSFIKDKTSVDGDTWSFFTESEKRYPEITLKKTVGRLVKEIMDHCRTRYILSNYSDSNLSCKLVNYVDISTTRENVAIVAHS